MADQQPQSKAHIFSSSSAVSSARWTSEGDLTIVFKSGRSYAYSEVPEAVFDGLVQAPSAGQYFHSQIKDAFS